MEDILMDFEIVQYWADDLEAERISLGALRARIKVQADDTAREMRRPIWKRKFKYEIPKGARNPWPVVLQALDAIERENAACA